MSNCQDLCTAEKCAELEARISALEQALELLEASFEAHTSQDIPEAHNYTPLESNLKIDGIFQSNILTLTVADGESQDTASIDIPIPEVEEHVESNLKIDGIFQSNILTLTVADGESQDTASINIPIPEVEEYAPRVNVEADIFDGTLAIDVTVGDSNDIATVDLPSPRVNVEADIFNGTLAIDVTVGDSNDIATVDLPSPLVNVEADIFNGTLAIDVTVGDSNDIATVDLPDKYLTFECYEIDENSIALVIQYGDDRAEVIINFPNMNCDELSKEFAECCSAILNTLNSLSLQLTNTESILNQAVDEVYREVTIDISGTTQTTYQCSFETDGNANLVPGYAQTEMTEANYQGAGMSGLNESLKLIHDNLHVIYRDVCRAIDPPSFITVNDLYKYCASSVDVNRSLYFDESNNPRYSNASEDYEQAIIDALNALLAETKYAYLINNATNGRLIEAPTNWITPILADFSLIQSRINNDVLCKIKDENSDVVSIVASDRFIARASGKILVLHFVTEDNYPKRTRNSTYYPIHIPAAKEENFYDWCQHFEPLRWSRGNLYAELKFNEFKNPVSGFFSSKEAADEYFNSVLILTTATEKNRVYHEHKTPQTNITERVTRPYRAFIESVNDAGQAVCHIKYVPQIDPPCE